MIAALIYGYFLRDLSACKTVSDVERVRVEYLGKKGWIRMALKAALA
jgi:hypothetical protein